LRRRPRPKLGCGAKERKKERKKLKLVNAIKLVDMLVPYM
jgi:hypothetical protein